ncbi:MAG TPA: N-succinylarginine dihydrolase [Polyangiaceae bacterium]|jgi:succinylarginine dihydrolase
MVALGTREFQFDGLVGPTHNYGGLSPGNVASTTHGGRVSNPRAAALQGLAKMQFVARLGIPQAVLPPQARPSLEALRRLGFSGNDESVIAAAGAGDGLLLRLCASASAMWTANAATVAPSGDTADRRLHLTVANLHQMFHRSIEAPATTRVLRAVFADPRRFALHDPLPGGSQFSDEGAANHVRLSTSAGAAHLFAWGRSEWALRMDRSLYDDADHGPRHHPARQTLEASLALARLHQLDPARCFFPRQHPLGIDAGAFHTDVMAAGTGRFLMFHELAFCDDTRLVADLRRLLGDELSVVRATSRELCAASVVGAYPFNSQVLELPDGTMAILAPEDSREDAQAHAFLSQVVASGGPVKSVHYVDVRQSMRNGGGPACLRLRVALSDEEARALSGNVVLTDRLHEALQAWIVRRYRDKLSPSDLADPELAREGMTALDELSSLLGLGSVYDFQRAGGS